MRWSSPCTDFVLSIKIESRPNSETTWPIDDSCHAKVAGLRLDPGQNIVNLSFLANGDAIEIGPSLRLTVNSQWFASFFVPLLAGMGVAFIVMVGPRRGRRTWPEPVRRYSALLSGLLFCLAVGRAGGLVAPAVSITTVGAQFGALALVALTLPLLVEGFMRLSERRASGLKQGKNTQHRRNLKKLRNAHATPLPRPSTTTARQMTL